MTSTPNPRTPIARVAGDLEAMRADWQDRQRAALTTEAKRVAKSANEDYPFVIASKWHDGTRMTHFFSTEAARAAFIAETDARLAALGKTWLYGLAQPAPVVEASDAEYLSAIRAERSARAEYLKALNAIIDAGAAHKAAYGENSAFEATPAFADLEAVALSAHAAYVRQLGVSADAGAAWERAQAPEAMAEAQARLGRLVDADASASAAEAEYRAAQANADAAYRRYLDAQHAEDAHVRDGDFATFAAQNPDENSGVDKVFVALQDASWAAHREWERLQELADVAKRGWDEAYALTPEGIADAARRAEIARGMAALHAELDAEAEADKQSGVRDILAELRGQRYEFGEDDAE